jgi:hypothetical protein
MITYTITIEEKGGKMHITARGDIVEPVTEAEENCAADLIGEVREDIKLYHLAVQIVAEEERQLKAKLN